MSAKGLPPLPQPAIFDPGRYGVGFSPKQMTAYALQANVDLAAENERLRAALQSLYDVVIRQNRLGASWHHEVFGDLMIALQDSDIALALKEAP